MASREENIELVRAGYEAFNRRQFESALETADETTTWRPFFSVETEQLVGKSAILAAWENQSEMMDLRIDVDELIALDDTHVLAVATWTGRGAGSGAELSQTNAQVFTVVDGRLRAVETYKSKGEAIAAVT